MTEKQKRFADEYLIDLNATRAYKVAYPTVKKDEVAAVNGNRLLRNAKVKTYINEKMQQRAGRAEVTQDMVIKELAKIGFADEIKLNDKIRALELLGKHLGMFKDKDQSQGDNSGNIDQLIRSIETARRFNDD